MGVSILVLPDTLVRAFRPDGNGLAAAAVVARAYLEVVQEGRWREARFSEESDFCGADQSWHMRVSHPLLIDRAYVCLFLTQTELAEVLTRLGSGKEVQECNILGS